MSHGLARRWIGRRVQSGSLEQWGPMLLMAAVENVQAAVLQVLESITAITAMVEDGPSGC